VFDASEVADCVEASEALDKGFPHSGQNIAGSRIAAPHDEQGCKISGCDMNFEFRIVNFELPEHQSILNTDVLKFAIRNSHFEIPRSDALH
jgi:hypothetical protein